MVSPTRRRYVAMWIFEHDSFAQCKCNAYYFFRRNKLDTNTFTFFLAKTLLAEKVLAQTSNKKNSLRKQFKGSSHPVSSIHGAHCSHHTAVLFHSHEISGSQPNPHICSIDLQDRELEMYEEFLGKTFMPAVVHG